MSKKITLFSLLAFILLLNGCSDEWNDMVDSISGSGDDNPAPAEQKAATVASEAAPHQKNPGNTATQSQAAEEAATEVASIDTTSTEEVAAETEAAVEAPPEPKVSNHFHHTTTASSDGGKSLVMCPGHTPNFDKCSVGGTDIPFHGHDHGRVIYWNMFEEPRGDIICVKGDKSYRYRADRTIVYGSCG